MKEAGFGTLNRVVVITYLLATLSIGIYLARRASQSTNSFPTTSGRSPSWVIDFSIYATMLSMIIFTPAPERAFLTDWSYIAGNVAIAAIIPLLIYFYIPFFKKLKVTSVCEYLEARFGPGTCVIDSLLFVVYHSERAVIAIYLPTLVITFVSDISPYIVASLVGLLCVLYTFLGGFESVAWSDFTQDVTLPGGALAITILGVVNIRGGFGTVFADTTEHRELISAGNWKLNTATATIPTIFLGNIFNNLYQYTTSQGVVQCYQASGNLKETNKLLWTNGTLALISVPLFYGMGTMLYLSYTHEAVLLKGFNISSVVPYFILTEISPSVAGSFITTIFAAAQSTTSSSLNSISACISIDIRQCFFGKGSERHEVNFARFITIIAGTSGFGMSLYLITSSLNDLWGLFLFMTELLGVPLAGVPAVGTSAKRTDTFSVICGLILGIIFAYVYNNVSKGNSPLYISTISFIAAFVFAYILSFIAPSKHKEDITGLIVSEKDRPPAYISKTATKK